MKTPEWYYDEMVCCGVDFNDPEFAEQYDQIHGTFREFEEEANRTMDLLDLRAEHTLIDIGAGTGAFAFFAAQQCKKVFAVDVSPAMLKICEGKCNEWQINNVEFFHGGFLTYEHEAEPVDAVVCQMCLHHLPDFWKQVGLIRCFDMLKPGGRFYLIDVVFSFEMQNYLEAVSEWVEKHAAQVGNQALLHVKDEYSTMNWIMEGMLGKTGFEIEKAEYREGFLAQYLCRKPIA